MPTKYCPNCKIKKDLTDFYRNTKTYPKSTFNTSPYCKKCVLIKSKESHKKYATKIKKTAQKWRLANKEHISAYQKKWYANPLAKEMTTNNWLQRTYGITLGKYNEILNEQNGVCAICNNKCITGKRLSVDHNHKTGKIRGLLCKLCNSGIGLFNEDKNLLLKVIKYLE